MKRTAASLAYLMTFTALLAQAPLTPVPLPPKAGLWLMDVKLNRSPGTTPPNMDQTILTPGTSPSPLHSWDSPGPSKRRVCMTPAAMAKYGAPFYKGFGRCSVSGIQMSGSGMSGELTCDGNHTGKGTVTIAWKDAKHAKGKTTFSGEATLAGKSQPEQWDAEYSAVYVGPDCGKVQPYLQ
jgi:hypothetical protein